MPNAYAVAIWQTGNVLFFKIDAWFFMSNAERWSNFSCMIEWSVLNMFGAENMGELMDQGHRVVIKAPTCSGAPRKIPLTVATT